MVSVLTSVALDVEAHGHVQILRSFKGNRKGKRKKSSFRDEKAESPIVGILGVEEA